MTVAAVGATTRFKKARPCPICGGGDDMPRGQGRRCSGYLSADGRFAYCTREEHAGQAQLELTDPPSYRHILEGECRCGTTHAPARPADDLVATYDYVAADGTLLYQVVRLARKQFRQRRPDGNGGWIWNLHDTRRVLYHLPGVLAAAQAGETIYVAEGEKDVHAIEAAGANATCNPGGAGKWKPEYAAALQGANVVIIADRDEPGLEHANQVAQSLPAATTTIVQAAEGKDAYDHLAAGRTLDELQPLEQTAAPQTHEPIVFETIRRFLERPLPKSESLVGVTRQGTNLLPRYGWVMPWGREGSGKTSILVDLLFHAAAGIPWLHYPVARPIRFVVVINEGVPGGLQDKIAQKVELWAGDTDQVLDNIAIYVSPWGEFTFKNDQITQHARQYALDFQADYVALDPLHTLGTTGAGTPQETEEFKTVLRDFGLWNDLGILTAHHSNKNGMVSGDWARHPDTVIRLEKDGKNPATKITLEKARPADPDELGVPQLLEWQRETMGYRHIPLDSRIKVTDADLLARIHETLEAAAAPLTMTDLKEAVEGDDTRIGKLVKAEITAGRIHDEATRKDRYLLTPSLPDTDDTDKARHDAQTRMDTSPHASAHPTPTNDDQETPPEGGLVVGVPAAPVRGTGNHDATTGPHDRDIPEDAGPPDDIDWPE